MASIKSQLQQLEDQITNISYVLFSIQGIIFASLFGQFMEAKCSSFFLPFLLSFFAGAFSLNAIVWKILSLKKILDEIAQPPPPQSQSPPAPAPAPETMRITQTDLQPSPQEAATASSPEQISIDIMRPPSPSPSSSSPPPPPPPPPETAAPALTATEVTQAYWFHVRIPLFLSTGFFFLSLFACWYVPCRYSAPAAAAAAPPMVAHPRLYANRR